jgi:hypothetical protein
MHTCLQGVADQKTRDWKTCTSSAPFKSGQFPLHSFIILFLVPSFAEVRDYLSTEICKNLLSGIAVQGYPASRRYKTASHQNSHMVVQTASHPDFVCIVHLETGCAVLYRSLPRHSAGHSTVHLILCSDLSIGAPSNRAGLPGMGRRRGKREEEKEQSVTQKMLTRKHSNVFHDSLSVFSLPTRSLFCVRNF